MHVNFMSSFSIAPAALVKSLGGTCGHKRQVTSLKVQH